VKLYKVRHSTLSGGNVLWHTVQDAVEEIKMHLIEGDIGDEITVSIVDVSDREYHSLPEFEGY